MMKKYLVSMMMALVAAVLLCGRVRYECGKGGSEG